MVLATWSTVASAITVYPSLSGSIAEAARQLHPVSYTHLTLPTILLV